MREIGGDAIRLVRDPADDVAVAAAGVAEEKPLRLRRCSGLRFVREPAIERILLVRDDAQLLDALHDRLVLDDQVLRGGDVYADPRQRDALACRDVQLVRGRERDAATRVLELPPRG